ncbi:MAG: hypothetical protein HC805_01370 [Alkalinema sp. RL_2_19]|nr:hypothetical protein [Alkalinema sp. RL_2_19]
MAITMVAITMVELDIASDRSRIQKSRIKSRDGVVVIPVGVTIPVQLALTQCLISLERFCCE